MAISTKILALLFDLRVPQQRSYTVRKPETHNILVLVGDSFLEILQYCLDLGRTRRETARSRTEKEERYLSIVVSDSLSPLRGTIAIFAFSLLYLARFERWLGWCRGRTRVEMSRLEVWEMIVTNAFCRTRFAVVGTPSLALGCERRELARRFRNASWLDDSLTRDVVRSLQDVPGSWYLNSFTGQSIVDIMIPRRCLLLLDSEAFTFFNALVSSPQSKDVATWLISY